MDLPHQATVHSDPSQTQSPAAYPCLDENANTFGALDGPPESGGRPAELRPYSTATGILPIRACQSRGPVWCTDSPEASTATVTGMSWTWNS